MNSRLEAEQSVDHLVVGAGFAGLCMAIKLQEDGEHDFLVVEQGSDVGGTWRDNTYPGAACDVPSQLYSFSFAPNPDWSMSFSPPAGDPRLPPPGRPRVGRARPLRVRHHRRGRPLGRGQPAVARDDQRGPGDARGP